MQQPVKTYRQRKKEQGKISLWLIGFLGLSPILVLLLVFVVMYWPTSTTPSSTTSASISTQVEKEMEDDGNVYRIDIELLSEPESNKSVVKWTKTVCEECYAIFEKHGVKRDISVRASYSGTVYGYTDYSQETGKFEFTQAE